MLLVKSKELKNLNKKNTPSAVLACLPCVLMFALSGPVSAQEAVKSITSTSSILSVFLSLLVVIAIIFAFAYVMRRFNVANAGNGQMRVVASMMAGSKEKVMVIEVGDEQHLLGITANNINHLAKLETKLANKSDAKTGSAQPPMFGQASSSSNKQSFQQKLVTAMAQGMTGAYKKQNGDTLIHDSAKSKGADANA